MPKVSMLCPIYNGEKYLEQAIRSVLNQTYRDFELILYDDGSTDGTPKILDRYAIADKRVKVISGGINRGGLYVRNELIKAANGEFVAWIDADDWYSMDFLQTAIEAQRGGDYDMVMFGNVEETVGNGQILPCRAHYAGFSYAGDGFLELCLPFLEMYRHSLWSRLIRTSVMKTAFFAVPEKRYIADDMFFTVSLFLAVKRFLYVDGKPYYHYRVDTGFWGGKLQDVTLARLRMRCELTRDVLLHWIACLTASGRMNIPRLRVCCENCELGQVAEMVYRMPLENHAEAETIFLQYFCENDCLPNRGGPRFPSFAHRLKIIMRSGYESIS